MTIFEMYRFMEFIINKDYEGNAFTPDQHNQNVKWANLDLFKIKMGLPEGYQPGQPISQQSFDATQMLTDDTRFLRKIDPTAALTGGLLEYPGDYFTHNSMRYNYQRNVDGVATTIPRMVEILTEDEYSDRAGRWLKRPTTWDPVAVIRAEGIQVYPITLNEVDFTYIRYPEQPNFSYVVQAGYIEEDQSNTVEFEWPEHLHMDLVRIMLSYCGINIRDEQLFQYAEQKKAQGA
jgi:hypothetical protein